MGDISELFWNASVDEIKQGYLFDAGQQGFVCLICGQSFTDGRVYQEGQSFYEARKFIQIHIAHEHSSMFDYLLTLDKKLTGLTDLQRNLVNYFHRGYSDSEIVKELDGGSTSTIRNHRFSLREKAKQAKIFLAIMELTEQKTPASQKFIPIHRSATMLDERYAITEEENETILKTYFEYGLNGPLKEFPKKEKRKVAILKHIIKRFDPDRTYTEKEVNAILKEVFDDYVTLRRYLIDYGFMERYADGSGYWVKA